MCEPHGCVGRRQDRVDPLVEQIVVERLRRPDARRAFTRDDREAWDARERAETLRARLDTAADEYAAGNITAAQLRRISETLRPQLADAERKAAEAVRGVDPDALAELVGEDAERRWQALTVAQQRAVLETIGLVVTIMPTRQGPGFDPESVAIEWRSS